MPEKGFPSKNVTGYRASQYDRDGNPTQWVLPNGDLIHAWKDGMIGGIPICGFRNGKSGNVCKVQALLPCGRCYNAIHRGRGQTAKVKQGIRSREQLLEAFGGEAGRTAEEFAHELLRIARVKAGSNDESLIRYVLEQLFGGPRSSHDVHVEIHGREVLVAIMRITARYMDQDEYTRWLADVRAGIRTLTDSATLNCLGGTPTGGSD